MNQNHIRIQRLKSLSSRIATFLLLAAPLSTFAQEYRPLSWFERAELTPAELQNLPEFCHGAYRVPEIPPLDGDQIEAESDSSTLELGGKSILRGNVIMQHHDKVVRSDEARWYQDRGYGEFEGNVSLTSPDLVLEGKAADVDQSTGQLNVHEAQYSMPKNHLRGTAEHINSNSDGTSYLKNATFTYCPPNKNDWDLAATTLYINQNEGYGSAWNTRLRLGEIPVFYMPYYRFPIGDQRMTGFLDPSLSLNGKGQLEDAQIPFYWNIAPNVDATFIPHYVREHGTAIETQLRHKTRIFGDGELNYAYLHKDDTTGKDRFLFNYQQQGVIGSGFQHRWVYNKVSDDEYLNDMNPMDAVNRTTHLPRRGEILWDYDDWHADITAEEFQTIDPNISLANRPYGRLPQLNASYRPMVLNEWQFQQRLQYTHFERKSHDIINGSPQNLTAFSALNGDRFLSDTSVAYPLEWPYAFVTPQVGYRYRYYSLHNADSALLNSPNAPELDVGLGSPDISLDAGLFFERSIDWFDTDYQQTLEPRIYYVYSPYVSGQNNIPNFDSALLTVTYSNLFTGERFTGGDRLADLNQMSLGLTSRFIRDDGLEQFKVSVGQVFYFSDRRVQLDRINTFPIQLPINDTRHSSSLLAEVTWNPSQEWAVFSTLEWDPYESFARQARTGVRYQNEYNRMVSLSSNLAQTHNSNTGQVVTNTDQIDASAFWALNDSWALVGRMLYDIRDYESPLKPPRSPVLESLAGVEYQNCCWRIQVLYRESSEYDDPSSNYSTSKRYGFMFSFQLKGLGAFGGGTDSLMNDGIQGYSRRTYHDY